MMAVMSLWKKKEEKAPEKMQISTSEPEIEPQRPEKDLV